VIGGVAEDKYVFVVIAVVSVASATDVVVDVGITTNGVVVVVVVIVAVITSGINGGGCVSDCGRGNKEVALDELGIVEDEVDDTTQGISTAIKGRASIKGRGAGGGAEGVASALGPTSDWPSAEEDEDDAAEEVDATEMEVLNGGVAGSRNRFCFEFAFELLGAVLPAMREGG
jgi:hypothetical protein